MLPVLERYHDPAHEPFVLNGGEDAALLVHGFPGSPAEMRPLAGVLNTAGWTVHGQLLPGFAREIETLPERTHDEWAAAIHAALRELRAGHRRVLLVGHSMGSALSLRAAVGALAAGCGPDGLILSAPYWRLGSWALPGIWPVLALLGARIKPFRLLRPYLDRPEIREGIAGWVGDLDFDDPQVRKAILDMELPVHVFNQLRLAGKAAWKAAPQAGLPTLVIQGLQDAMVSVPYTRRLLARLPGPLAYVEVPCDHDLVSDAQPAWPQISAAVREFARQVAQHADMT